MSTPIPANRAPFSVFAVRAASRGRVAHLYREDVEAHGVTTDSRAIEPGGVFVAIRGDRFDGHDYVDTACNRGAAVVVVERGRVAARRDVSIVEVDDTAVALGDLARAHLRRWRREHAACGRQAKVVAITGSAGKTTTKEFSAALLALGGSVAATHGNLNNLIGLPATALAVEATHSLAVLEAGMSVPGEIARLAAIAAPDIAIITNIGVAHAGGVGGTRADVAREKGALFAALPPTGVAIGHGSDAAIRGELLRSGANCTLLFGRGADCDVRLVARRVHVTGTRLAGEFEFAFSAQCMKMGAPARLTLTLPHFSEVHGLAIAASLATYLAAVGPLPLDGAAIAAALAAVRFEGRFVVTPRADGAMVIDDTYNANPQSMQASLRALRELRDEAAAPTTPVAERGRLVAILGEMRELGDRAEADHVTLGRQAAEVGVDLLIGCGGMATRACAEAEALGVDVHVCESAAEARALAMRLVRAKDWVLVKASRGVKAETVVEGLLEATVVATTPALGAHKDDLTK